jgi:FkbM family methyltransferase
MTSFIKRILRKFGFDVVRYHPLFDILLKKYDIDTVIDIGANNGQFALDIHERLPHAKIYSFEPLNDAFLELTQKLGSIANFHAFNIGLGNANKTSTINRSSFSPSSSLLPMTDLHKQLYPKSADSIAETITIKRLDDMASEMQPGSNVLVKLDVQGYEDEVLRGGAKTIARSRVLVTETSFATLYEGQPLFDDIYKIVYELGFRYAGSRERHYNTQTGELLYEDAIFVNTKCPS